MPDLDPLPPRPRPPHLEPRAGEYALMTRRARRRRGRQAGAAGAGLAGFVVAVALAGGSGAGTIGLDPVPPAANLPRDAEATSSPGESPAPEESAEPTATAPGEPGATGSPEPAPEPSASAEPAPVPEPEPSGDATEAPERDPHLPPPARPRVERDEVPYRAESALCESGPVLTSSGWCIQYEGHATVRGGEPYEYRLLACRPGGRGAGTLTFRTEQQVEFEVASANGRSEWTWSGGYAFPERETTVTVAESRCARWTVEWDVTDQYGDPLRPGTYYMSAAVVASDWGDGSSMSYGTSAEFEVTD